MDRKRVGELRKTLWNLGHGSNPPRASLRFLSGGGFELRLAEREGGEGVTARTFAFESLPSEWELLNLSFPWANPYRTEGGWCSPDTVYANERYTLGYALAACHPDLTVEKAIGAFPLEAVLDPYPVTRGPLGLLPPDDTAWGSWFIHLRETVGARIEGLDPERVLLDKEDTLLDSLVRTILQLEGEGGVVEGVADVALEWLEKHAEAVNDAVERERRKELVIRQADGRPASPATEPDPFWRAFLVVAHAREDAPVDDPALFSAEDIDTLRACAARDGAFLARVLKEPRLASLAESLAEASKLLPGYLGGDAFESLLAERGYPGGVEGARARIRAVRSLETAERGTDGHEPLL
jgi:hypothetical protein